MAARTTLSPGTLFGLFGPSLDGRSLADKPRRPLLLVASYATSHFANHIASVRSRLPSSAANWPVLVTTDETSPAYLADHADPDDPVVFRRAYVSQYLRSVKYQDAI